MENHMKQEYYMWLYALVCRKKAGPQTSYRKITRLLFNTEFSWTIPMDENRAIDGLSLRREYAIERNDPDLELYLQGPCSVLEMMIGLSLRCERDIMANLEDGYAVDRWFWNMMESLGLANMTDDNYNEGIAKLKVNNFLNHDYEPNGKGGLFTIHEPGADVRDLEIWKQMNWYLDEITR